MLVPSMTLQEIKNSLILDYQRELKMKLTGIYLSAEGKWFRNGRKAFAETVSFVTKSKNHWRISVQMDNRGAYSVTPYLIAYDNVGIKAFHFIDPLGSGALLYFNTHFFKRYRERRKIDIEKPEDVVKHFFKHNPHIIPYRYQDTDGTQKLFIPFDNGVGLGKFNEAVSAFEFKTFVDDDLLRQEQWQSIINVYNNVIDLLDAQKKGKVKNLNNDSGQNGNAA